MGMARLGSRGEARNELWISYWDPLEYSTAWHRFSAPAGSLLVRNIHAHIPHPSYFVLAFVLAAY